MTTRRAAAGEIEIAYEDRGQGARPLVLVHGYTGYRQDFETQWGALASDRRVLAPDLRGHGESGGAKDPAGYSLASLTRDLAQWMDALALGPVDLLGHSMGGMLALRLALAEPERVASLILMDTSARPLDHVDRGLFDKAASLVRAAGMEALQKVMRARAADDPSRPDADRRVAEEWGEERYWRWRDTRMAAMDPEAYASLGPAMFEAESLVPRLAELSCPTLVLVGEDDTEFREPAEEMARLIPDARLVVLAGAAHQPQHEAPEAWLDAVRKHLARVR